MSLQQQENLRLSPAMLSRFDVTFVLLDRPDEIMDQALSEHVMALHSGVWACNTDVTPVLTQDTSAAMVNCSLSCLHSLPLLTYCCICTGFRPGPCTQCLHTSIGVFSSLWAASLSLVDQLLHCCAPICLCFAQCRPGEPRGSGTATTAAASAGPSTKPSTVTFWPCKWQRARPA